MESENFVVFFQSFSFSSFCATFFCVYMAPKRKRHQTETQWQKRRTHKLTNTNTLNPPTSRVGTFPGRARERSLCEDAIFCHGQTNTSPSKRLDKLNSASFSPCLTREQCCFVCATTLILENGAKKLDGNIIKLKCPHGPFPSLSIAPMFHFLPDFSSSPSLCPLGTVNSRF